MEEKNIFEMFEDDLIDNFIILKYYKKRITDKRLIEYIFKEMNHYIYFEIDGSYIILEEEREESNRLLKLKNNIKENWFYLAFLKDVINKEFEKRIKNHIYFKIHYKNTNTSDYILNIIK